MAVQVAMTARKQEVGAVSVPLDHDTMDQPRSHFHEQVLLSSMKRSRVHEGDPQAREKAEQARRIHWLGQLRDVVFATELPMVSCSAAFSTPSPLRHAIGQGKRASSIRR